MIFDLTLFPSECGSQRHKVPNVCEGFWPREPSLCRTQVLVERSYCPTIVLLTCSPVGPEFCQRDRRPCPPPGGGSSQQSGSQPAAPSQPRTPSFPLLGQKFIDGPTHLDSCWEAFFVCYERRRFFPRMFIFACWTFPACRIEHVFLSDRSVFGGPPNARCWEG